MPQENPTYQEILAVLTYLLHEVQRQEREELKAALSEELPAPLGHPIPYGEDS